MKLSIFAFVGILCLVAVNAGTFGQLEPLEFDIEYINNDLAQPEEFGIWSGMYWTLKAALRTLKGFNCTIKEVISLRSTCIQYLADLNACGGAVSTQVQAVINGVNNIITICNNIIHLNSTICGNSDDTDAETATEILTSRTGWNCFWKVLKQMMKLKKQIQSTLKAIKNLPSDTSACVMTATDKLTTAFNNFPSNIRTCSKLTSS